MLLTWLVAFREWRWLLGYSTARSDNFTFWSLANFTYYPQLLIITRINLLAVILMIVGGVIWVRQRKFRLSLLPLLVAFILSLVMLTVVLYKIPRFGMILFPPIWIGAAVAASDIFDLLQRRPVRAVYLSLLLITLVAAVFYNSYSLQFRMQDAYENSSTAVDQAFGYIAEALDLKDQSDRRIILEGRTDRSSSLALRFYLVTHCPVAAGCQISVLDERDLNYGYPRLDIPIAERRNRKRLADASADSLVAFTDEAEVAYPGWTLASESGFWLDTGKPAPEWMRVLIFRHAPSLSASDPHAAQLWRP